MSQMRYKSVGAVLYGTLARGVYESFRSEFSQIEGWEVWDDQVSAAIPSLVFKVTTSEGVGNEFYPRFWYQDANLQKIDIYETWNNVAHTGTNRIGSGRYDLVNATDNTYNYTYAANRDHLYLYFTPSSQPTSYTPIYIGLLDKMYQAQDTATKGVVLLTWYHFDGHATASTVGTSFSDNAKVPYMRGSDNVYNQIAYLYRTNLFMRGQNVDEWMPHGPFYMDSTGFSKTGRSYWSRPLLSEDTNGFGPRGWLKSVLIGGSALRPGSVAATRDIIRVGSRDYMVIKTNYPFDTTVDRRSPWAVSYANTTFQYSWLMPVSDHYTRCYINGSA